MVAQAMNKKGTLVWLHSSTVTLKFLDFVQWYSCDLGIAVIIKYIQSHYYNFYCFRSFITQSILGLQMFDFGRW